MDLKFRNLYASEVEARPGRGNEEFVPIFLYKDARCDQRILDATVGPMNWQKRYANSNTNCIVSIWDKEKQQWVEKEDVGQGSGPDARKGTASDSFKRACFAWGIGRELYTTPKLLVPASVLTNYRVEKDGAYCDNTFRVQTLEGTEDHIITDVVIEILLRETVVHTVEYHNPAEGTAGTVGTPAPVTNVTEKSSTSSKTVTNATPASGTAGTAGKPGPSVLSEADIAVMYAKADLAGTTPAGVQEWTEKKFGVSDVYSLTLEQYQTVCNSLDKQAAKKKSA